MLLLLVQLNRMLAAIQKHWRSMQINVLLSVAAKIQDTVELGRYQLHRAEWMLWQLCGC